LRRPGADIPIAQSDGPGYYGAQHYTLVLREFRDRLLPEPNGTTRLWSYTPENGPNVHLGALFWPAVAPRFKSPMHWAGKRSYGGTLEK
jgi:hypothetical protein